MTDYNGAFLTYGDSPADTKVFFRASSRKTKPVTIKQGQVIKALSFLETDTTGKAIAHSGINEKALVTFADITTGQTIILAGLTFTAGASGCTKADLVTAWSNLTAGTTAAAANTANPVTGGTFTAGTLTGYNTDNSATADSVLFVSTTPYAGVTDLADTGTATDPTIVVTAVADPQKKIAGVLVYDVDATAGDVDAVAYEEASFWGNALTWKINYGVDKMTKFDGSLVNYTAYDTGCAGTTAASNLLKEKFVEGSEFAGLGFNTAGEQY